MAMQVTCLHGPGNRERNRKQGAQAMSGTRNEHSSMDQYIDSIRLRENDRQIAKAHMHNADVVAELFGRAVENLRSGRETLAHLFVQRAAKSGRRVFATRNFGTRR
jgi:hypothetical protein